MSSSEATLVVPRTADRGAAVLRPKVEVEVPSYPYAGQYAMRVSVRLVDAPEVTKTDLPRR